jgi:hypothetical protein
MKTGITSPATTAGVACRLDVAKALGVSVDSWGKESLQVRSPYTELLA